MNNTSICRIGVFYDGNAWVDAQDYFDQRQLGWLSYISFHTLIEDFIRAKEQGYSNYRVVCSGWYQGLHTLEQYDEEQSRIERNRHLDLIDAGIELKYLPMSPTQGGKGVEVAMAVDALQVGVEGYIDVAVMVTGNENFIPLIRALMKYGIRVAIVYFAYETESQKRLIRLLRTCNYSLDINALEADRRHQILFYNLFKRVDKIEKHPNQVAKILGDHSETEKLAKLTPFQLGESNKKEAIPYLIGYLSGNSSYNQRRLAASAIGKLAKIFPNDCQSAVSYLLDNLSNPAPQVRQYCLKALHSLNLPDYAIIRISEIAENDTKGYNRDIAQVILNKITKNR